ncbi:MAG: hypothetical protein F2667_09860 [Actinobacteria bacterium]|uniref:Unannotated protein n=1 Tax=freshwater metagenome TaxID=449393 RepID=A0A6J6R8P4_9ZZZZ|nr:hypothetical protein [Actinomycetota bacterium]
MDERRDLDVLDDRADGLDDVESSAIERTGVAAVDAVVDAVAELGDQPLESHLAVFEAAHEQLRRALDARPVDEPA